jgi:hypothetical protein
MSNNDEETTAERVVKYNEKFNVSYQTEKEQAETSENAEVEHLAHESAIERKKRGRLGYT